MTAPPGHHAPLDYHLALLSDPWRIAAWDAAIREVVRPGDRVLDVGTGTGVLAVLAARAGGQVVAVESAWIAEIARETVARNGVADRVEVVAEPLEVVPPRPMDVILGDWVGRLLPEEQLRQAMIASRAWAAPGARWLPAAVRYRAAPIGDATLPGLARWEHSLLGVDLGAALPAARATAWSVHLGRGAALAPPADLGGIVAPDFRGELAWQGRFVVARDGELQGVAGWFESELTPNVRLDTAPGRRTFWGQVLWPCPAVAVRRGDTVDLALRGTSEVGRIHFGWEIRARRGGETLLVHVAHTEPLASPPIQGVPAVSGRDAGLAESGRARWAAGDADLAAPELIAAATDEAPAEVHADLVAVLVARGEEVALDLLQRYEERFGPHPTLRVRA